jgi:hypothetical protein
MKTNDLENALEFDKELPGYYPLVNFGGELVKYDPNKHELEKGERAAYFDIDEQKIREGIIEIVEHSNPFNYPVYVINGKPHMNHRVWPKIDNNKVNLSEQENNYLENIKKSIPPGQASSL